MNTPKPPASHLPKKRSKVKLTFLASFFLFLFFVFGGILPHFIGNLVPPNPITHFCYKPTLREEFATGVAVLGKHVPKQGQCEDGYWYVVKDVELWSIIGVMVTSFIWIPSAAVLLARQKA